MITSKLISGVILGLALLIGVGSSKASDLWNLDSNIYGSFAIHTIRIMHFGDTKSNFLENARSMMIFCNNDGGYNWLIGAYFGDLDAIGSNVKVEIQFDNEAPEKPSNFTFVREETEKDSFLNLKMIEKEFDDLNSFISMNRRLAKSNKLTVRVYDKQGALDMDALLSTSGLSGILPEFHRRCEESKQ